MARVPIKLVTRSYDIVMPLALGDVGAEGIDLTIDRATPISALREDPSYQAGETSFSKYLIGLSKGDRSLVGLPIYPMRAFRHRCFFVHRDSGLTSFADLEGKRIGTNGWFDTGNTWSRAAMREQGTDLNSIEWWAGPVDDSVAGDRSKIVNLPPHVQAVPEGGSLAGMLKGGGLDAMMVPWPPQDYFAAGSPIVRLYPDYEKEERAYYDRTGIFPIHHIIALRRDVFEEHPWIARSLFEAFEQARRAADRQAPRLADTSPWSLVDIERTIDLMGPDWQAHGIEPNRNVITALTQEQEAQGLVAKAVDPASAFEDFERVMNG